MRIVSLVLLSFCIGCVGGSDDEVIVYTALDREFSEPIFQQFTKETGIQVRAKYDTETTKSVSLAQAILEEGNPPRCDIFWNNEIVNTLRLDQAGRLGAFHSEATSTIPAAYRAADDRWFGFAARARVLIVNTDRIPQHAHAPASVLDLTETKWKGQIGMAKPLFGTTATHAMVLFDTWGKDRAEAFFRAVRNNTQIMAGNKQVAQSVARGELAWGITDTDDAIVEIERGSAVRVIFPDQQPDQMGTLMIPNTLALVDGAPNAARAERLMEYLLSARIERQLAQGRSAQIPLRTDVAETSRVMPAESIRPMEVDFESAAKQWNEVAVFLRDTFARVE